MKKCTKCKIIKEKHKFSKELRRKDGYAVYCKECILSYSRLKSSVILKIYGHQKENSFVRNHNLPTYTKEQLLEWLLNDWVFGLLYQNWCNCGYIESMKPSIDRIDDNKGYSFDNVQIMTWGENRAKGAYLQSIGKQNVTKPIKPILQLSLDGKLIKEYLSASEASRITKLNRSCISKCCRGEFKQFRGFVWKFK